MIQHLRIREAFPLLRSELTNLGRINVVCGRNNSGKSTVLLALATRDAISEGRETASMDVKRLALDILPATGWRGDPNYSAENQQVHELAEFALAPRAVWFGDESADFARPFQRMFEEGQLGRWSIDLNAVVGAFKKQFHAQPTSTLLPPKRSLEILKPINLNEPVHPDGIGLLNFLFFAKNQPAGSDSRSLHDAIHEAFVSISNGYNFQTFPTKENQIHLHFSRGTDTWIAAGFCGLGLQDLLIILYFALAPSTQLILIEEPESHVHPDMQRRLLSFLSSTQKQYFLTTHSNVFLDNAFVSRVFFTRYDGQIHLTDETSRASILDDLGYSVTDNLVSDLIILVEGPTDTPVIEEFLKHANLYGRFVIKTWPLGGDVMDRVDLSVFAEGYRILAIVDKDPGSSAIRNRFRQKCIDAGIEIHVLQRYSIESYFTLDAIRSVFKNQVPDNVTTLDPEKSVRSQIGIDVKKNNRKIAKAMSLSDIAGTDLGDFFQKIATLLGA